MELTTPSYYHRFRCLAGNCPDSCCKEWDVQVDPDAAGYYRSLPGELGERLRQVLLDTEDGILMRNENGRCPMWRQDGLCRIQAELGERALCQVCRDFPRLKHDYGSFMELGLELSCPEAARLILTSPAAPPVVLEVPGGEEPEYDTEAMDVLLQTRESALALISNDTYTIPQALVLLLYYGYHAQTLLDGGEEPDFVPEKILSEAQSMVTPADGQALTAFFADLEVLTPTWEQRLQTPLGSAQWPDEIRSLARYGIERYWLQAVSDYDLVCRVKLIVTSCLLVKLLGGNAVETAQLYSKEIENNAENVDAILDAAYTHPALTDDQLISQLLT